MWANELGEENIIIRVPTSALVQFLETLGNRRSLRSKTECQGPRWHQGNCSPPASGLLRCWTHIKCSASAPQQLARTPVHGRAILEERTLTACVLVTQWERPGLAAWGPTYTSFAPFPALRKERWREETCLTSWSPLMSWHFWRGDTTE